MESRRGDLAALAAATACHLAPVANLRAAPVKERRAIAPGHRYHAGMIALTLAFFVLPALWLAAETQRAPIACEGPHGLQVISPCPRGNECRSVPAIQVHPARYAFWGLD